MIKQQITAVIFSAMMMSTAALSADSVKPNGCKGPTLCTSNPIIDACGGYFDVGLIYEQMSISNTAFAYAHSGNDLSVPDSTKLSPFRTNQMAEMSFDMEPGLKIGLGYNTEDTGWGWRANFEWLSSTAKYNKELRPGVTFHSTAVQAVYNSDNNIEQLGFQKANGSLSVDYYLLDVTLSRGSYFSENFSYEPFAGIKAAWINYGTIENFSEDLSTSGVLPSGSSWLHRFDTAFWGVGPMVGIDSNYYIFAGWSFFSTANFAVLLGSTKIDDYIGIVTSQAYPGTNYVFGTSNVLCPTLRTIIGLQYDMDAVCVSQHLRLRIGFDGRYYFNQYPLVQRVAGAAPLDESTNLGAHPVIVPNNSFGMIGLVLDLGWSF